MLTLFSIPKAFQGHTAVIQKNAIRSWTKLNPDYEIILFGNDDGTAEIAAELGLKHVPEVECNEYGTPLINSMFDTAQKIAKYDTLCWINADIIVLNDFITAVEKAVSFTNAPEYLIIGRRWNIDLKDEWDFSNPDWEERLRAYAEETCKQNIQYGMDYYIFNRGLFPNLPPFAVGRLSASNWMVYQVLSQGIPVIDITPAATAIHQRHNYAHQNNVMGDIAATADNIDPLQTYAIISQSPEAEINRQLAGGENPIFSPYDVTWILTKNGTFERPSIVLRLYRRIHMYKLPLISSEIHPFRKILQALIAITKPLRLKLKKSKTRFK